MGLMSLPIASAILYGVMSLLLTIVNKVIFVRFTFDYPLFLLILQMVFTVLLLQFLRLLNKIQLSEYTFQRARETFVVSIFYCLHSVFSLSALASMNIPMYGTLKRCVPLMNLYLAVCVLKRPCPGRGLLLSVLLLTGGAILAGSDDIGFDPVGYLYGAASVVCQALYLTLFERQSKSGDYKLADLILLNSLNSILILCVVDLFSDQLISAYIFFLTKFSYWFLANLIAIILLGICLNCSIFWCTSENSALTTSVVGNVKATAQTVLGFWLGLVYFGDTTLRALNIIGILVNLFGCTLYSYVKYREKKLKRTTDRNSSISGVLEQTLISTNNS